MRRPHKVSFMDSWLIICIGSYTNNMKGDTYMVSKKPHYSREVLLGFLPFGQKVLGSNNL